MFSKIVQKLSQTFCRRVDMGANLEIFSLDENPEGKGCFNWYQISGNLKIFGCSSANAAIVVVLLFEINSSINRKKNYVNNSWSANAGLLEEVGLLRSCSVHYTHQQKKIYTQVQYQKEIDTLQWEDNHTKNEAFVSWETICLHGAILYAQLWEFFWLCSSKAWTPKLMGLLMRFLK